MRTYLELFRTKGVAAVIWSQLLARFAFGMSTITFAVHLQQIFNNYTVAGLAIGAMTVGQALSGPILGRWLATWGIRPVVVMGSLLAPVCYLLIGFAPISEGFAIAVSLVLGLAMPPIQAAARAVYRTLVKSESQRTTLFSVDAILQEIIWILGPVLATVFVATTNTIVPIIAMAAIQLFGGLWFALLPQVHDAPIPRSTKRMGSVLRSRMVRVMIVVNLLFVASFSALEIGTIAAVGQAEAGFVICMLSIGSVVGGLAWGHRARSPRALTYQLGIVLLGDLFIFFNATNAIWLGVCLFISGIGVALAFATIGMIISKTVNLDDTTEAYGWINSGQSIGYGAGAAVAGIVVDKLTSTTSFVLATGLDFLALVVALSAVAITPAFLNSESKKEDSK